MVLKAKNQRLGAQGSIASILFGKCPAEIQSAVCTETQRVKWHMLCPTKFRAQLGDTDTDIYTTNRKWTIRQDIQNSIFASS